MNLPYLMPAMHFARTTRGETGTGDRIWNADAFAFYLGFNSPEAPAIADGVEADVEGYSQATGLPPSSLARFVSNCRAGIRERSRGEG